MDDKKVLYDGQVTKLYGNTMETSPHVLYLIDPTFNHYLNKFKSEYYEINDISPFTIIDLACGDGKYTKWLKQLFPKALVVGADISPEMIQKAINNTDKELCINYLVKDCSDDLSSEINYADLITALFLLNYMTNESEMLKLLTNIKKLLKPGAKFYSGQLNFDLKNNFKLLPEWDKLQPIYPAVLSNDTRVFEKIQKMKLVMKDVDSGTHVEFPQYWWDFELIKEISLQAGFEDVVILENILSDKIDKEKHKIFMDCPIFSFICFK